MQFSRKKLNLNNLGSAPLPVGNPGSATDHILAHLPGGLTPPAPENIASCGGSNLGRGFGEGGERDKFLFAGSVPLT